MFIRAGTRPGPAPRGRRNAALLAAGLVLAAAGAWMLANQLAIAANRRRDEAALRSVYYADASGVAQIAPAAEPPPLYVQAAPDEPAPTADTSRASVPAAAAEGMEAAPAPVPSGTLARTFQTRAPWAAYAAGERFLALRKINPDVAGWLTIDGMLDLPVVQRDNDFYLDHDFYGKPIASGTLFLDEGFSFYPPCENLLIHGHNMRDGSMFGRLKKYRDRAFYINHCIIRFDTLYETGEYAVFAAFTTRVPAVDGSGFLFLSARFDTDARFMEYIAAAKMRSYYPCGLDVAPGDALLTLSTCADGQGGYFVVLARKLRPGETAAGARTTCVITSAL